MPKSNTERLRIAPKQSVAGETFALGYFEDARADWKPGPTRVAKVYQVKLPPQPVGYCTWYSDKHAGAVRRSAPGRVG